MKNIWDKYPEVKEELQAIQSHILSVNKTGERYLDDSIDYMFLTGGKMLRPGFVLIGSMFSDHQAHEKIRNIAAAIEILHMATLVHDDIIDDSDLRRGQPSLQAKYSKDFAVYMGDYLFTQVFMILSKYDYTRENLYDISRGISKICIGEMLQNRLRFNADIKIKDYLKIVSGKTAGLFAVSLGIGGQLAGVDRKLARKLTKIGYSIGMAFQIQDDLLDYKGDTDTVGKDTLSDLANGYYTLPVIYAIRQKAGIKDFLGPDMSLKEVMSMIHDSSAIGRTRALAEKYTNRALKLIDELPEGQGKDLLNELVPLLLKRSY